MIAIESPDGKKSFYPKNRKEWRNWLQKNHAVEKCVWLIMYNKQSETPGVLYAEAVEEALCFGWIDSKAMKRDAESRFQYFAQRKPNSKWSKLNRERVMRMVREGLMTPAGQALIDHAKKTGTWDALVDVENSVIPEDLKKRFAKNKKALQNFEAFSPSSKRIILEWILNAKRPETRTKRINEAVSRAAQNEKAYP